MKVIQVSLSLDIVGRIEVVSTNSLFIDYSYDGKILLEIFDNSDCGGTIPIQEYFYFDIFGILGGFCRMTI